MQDYGDKVIILPQNDNIRELHTLLLDRCDMWCMRNKHTMSYGHVRLPRCLSFAAACRTCDSSDFEFYSQRLVSNLEKQLGLTCCQL
jgi:hypothetical protein